MSADPSHLVLPSPPSFVPSPLTIDPTHVPQQPPSTLGVSLPDDVDDDDVGYEDMSGHSRSNPPIISHPQLYMNQSIDQYPLELQHSNQDDDDDMDYAGEDLGDSQVTSRKRGRSGNAKGRVSKRARKKPVATETTIPDRLAGLDPEAQARVMVMTQEFDAALKATSSHRSRRTDLEDPQRLEERATFFLGRMKLAALQDQEAHEAGHPAVSKLNMLPELETELERADMRDVLLDHHILEGFITWLEPLRLDGSLPAFQVRKTLMEILLKLPISTDHLREDRIGRVVMFYSKYTKETPEIRRLAHQCITKWTRPILNLSDTYADTRGQPQIDVNLSAIRRQRVLRSVGSTQPSIPTLSGTQSNAQGSSLQRLRLPPARGTGYTVRPVDNLPDAAALRRRTAPSGLARVVSKLRQGGTINSGGKGVR